MEKAPLSPNFAARLTPHYSIVAVPLFTSEAADRIVAVRVRTAVTCPSAARTPARSPDEHHGSLLQGGLRSYSSMSKQPLFASQLWKPGWHSQLKEPTELMQLV